MLKTYYRFFIPPGARVLEIGCGLGNLLAAVKPARGVGIDFSPALLAAAREQHPDLAFFGAELKRASQMRRLFYGNFWGAPFTDRMIEFARGHRGIRKVLGKLVAGDQGYTDLKKKLARSALKPL